MKSRTNSSSWNSLFLLLILLLAAAIRLSFLDLDEELGLSDESEYVVMASSFAQGKILFQWPYYRPFLLPAFWAFLATLGFGILSYHLSFLAFSLASILLLYLIGKDLFNAKIGLVAALLLAFFPEELFYSTKLLLNSPALTLWLLALYTFQKAYFQQSVPKLYLAGLVTGVAILFYTQNIILLCLFLAFLLLVEGPTVLTKRHYLAFFTIPLLFYFLNFLYSFLWFGSPFTMTAYGLWLSLVDTSSRTYASVLSYFTRYLPSYFSWFLIPLLMLTLFLLVRLFLPLFTLLAQHRRQLLRPTLLTLSLSIPFFLARTFLDPSRALNKKTAVLSYGTSTVITLLFGFLVLYFYRDTFRWTAHLFHKKPDIRKHLFLLLWIILSFIGISLMVGAFQARYFIPTITPFFLYFGFILAHTPSLFPQYRLVRILPFLLIILSIPINLNYAYDIAASYTLQRGSRDAGLWLRAHTTPDDTLLGTGNPALAYYSSRTWHYYPLTPTLRGNSYEGLLQTITTLRPKFLTIYYVPNNPSTNTLYLAFVKNNNERVTLVYNNTTSDQKNLIQIYALHYENAFT